MLCFPFIIELEPLVTELTPKRPRVVITGISRGIGRATALAYASLGGRVAGLHRDGDPTISEELSDAIRARGGEPLIRVGDIRSTADIDGLADDAAAAWGGIMGVGLRAIATDVCRAKS